jgi:hypothetical protein
MIYPQVTREQLHSSVRYTLWLTDMIQMHLTEDQYKCLKFSVDRIGALETPMTAQERDTVLRTLGHRDYRPLPKGHVLDPPPLIELPLEKELAELRVAEGHDPNLWALDLDSTKFPYRAHLIVSVTETGDHSRSSAASSIGEHRTAACGRQFTVLDHPEGWWGTRLGQLPNLAAHAIHCGADQIRQQT